MSAPDEILSALETARVRLANPAMWHKGNWYPHDASDADIVLGDCPTCLMGAVGYAWHGNLPDLNEIQPGDGSSLEEFMEEVGALLVQAASVTAPDTLPTTFRGDAAWCRAARWNDGEDRTHAEVLAALDEAIAIRKGRASA